MSWVLHQFPSMHWGPIDTKDRRPHLSRRCSNCIVACLSHSLPIAILYHSAAQTILVLMKPSDEVAIIDFCHCHWGQPVKGEGHAHPRGVLHTPFVTFIRRKLSCCQKQLVNTRGLQLTVRVIVKTNDTMVCGDGQWGCLPTVENVVCC